VVDHHPVPPRTIHNPRSYPQVFSSKEGFIFYSLPLPAIKGDALCIEIIEDMGISNALMLGNEV
jgi:hypothetical protein